MLRRVADRRHVLATGPAAVPAAAVRLLPAGSLAALLTGLLTGLLALAMVGSGAGPATATTALHALGRPVPASWVAGEPTAISVTVDRLQVTFGAAVTFTGRLVDPATGAGLPTVDVRLESLDAASGTWVGVVAATSDPAGSAVLTATPSAGTTYRLHHGDPGTAEESFSPAVTVTVAAAIGASVVTPVVAWGRAVRVTGRTLPADGAVRVERQVAGGWRVAGRVVPAADGSFTALVTPGAPGWFRWRLVREATAGRLGAVLDLPRVNSVRMHTYVVDTRGRVRGDLAGFRSSVAATLGDPRGWLAAHHGFREVRSGGDFTVVLAHSATLPRFSRVCSTTYSCRVGRYVVINDDRWRRGSPFFPADLRTYRQMVVNHETGHWLGRPHAYCSAPGRLAPVMQQQSKGTQGCRPNPWPLARELGAVS